MFYPFKATVVAASVAIALIGCGVGDEGNDAAARLDSISNAPVVRSITAVPSLGVISNATVNIYKADGTSLLGSADLGSLGKATVTFNDYFGPVVIEVVGNANAQYFDEATNSLVGFPASEKLHAIAPVSDGTFAVTMLTELAYQGAVSKNYFPLGAYRVTQLNERVRLGVVPEVTNLLAAPAAFTSSTTVGSLANDDAGRYALKLAALAQFGKSDASPALSVMKVLAKDLVDGDFDGKDGANTSVGAPYTSFSAELKTKLTAMATNFGATELKTAVPTFTSLASAINLSDIPTGSANDAAAVGVFITPALEGVARIPKDPLVFETVEDEQYGSITRAKWGNANSPVTITVAIGKFFPPLSTDWLTLSIGSEKGAILPRDVSLYVGCEVAGPVDESSSCASAGILYNPETKIMSFGGTVLTQLLLSSEAPDLSLGGSLRFGPVASGTTTGGTGSGSTGSGSTGSGSAGSGSAGSGSAGSGGTGNIGGVTGNIAAGAYYSVTIKADGTVWEWGDNKDGQLGDGTTTDRSMPVKVLGLTDAKFVTGGFSHTIALTKDGAVWAWGANGYGQLGDGTTVDRSQPVRAQGLSDIIAVAGEYGQSSALKSDGTVWTWGDNSDGQLGDGSTTRRSVPVQASALTGIVAIDTGWDHALALKNDGTVWAWGLNESGQLGDGTKTARNVPVQVRDLSGVVAISAGASHSIALMPNGTVWAWGDNGNNQLGDGTTVDRLAPIVIKDLTGVTAIAGGYGTTYALKGDGTVWKVGSGGPNQITGLAGIVEIASWGLHLIAEASDGTVWTFGWNGDGELGDGTTAYRFNPVHVGGLNLLN